MPRSTHFSSWFVLMDFLWVHMTGRGPLACCSRLQNYREWVGSLVDFLPSSIRFLIMSLQHSESAHCSPAELLSLSTYINTNKTKHTSKARNIIDVDFKVIIHGNYTNTMYDTGALRPAVTIEIGRSDAWMMASIVSALSSTSPSCDINWRMMTRSKWEKGPVSHFSSPLAIQITLLERSTNR